MKLIDLFDKCATAKVLDFMIENKDVYSKTELAENTGLSRATIRRVISKLKEIKAVTFDKRLGNCQMYKINNESGIVDLFKQLKNV